MKIGVTRPHHGTDQAVPTGTSLHTMGVGKVIDSYKSKIAFGNTIIIGHGKQNEGKYKGKYVATLYAHNSKNTIEKDRLFKKVKLLLSLETPQVKIVKGVVEHTHILSLESMIKSQKIEMTSLSLNLKKLLHKI